MGAPINPFMPFLKTPAHLGNVVLGGLRETFNLGIVEVPINDLPEKPRTSGQYGIMGFKGGLQSAPHCAGRLK